MNVFKFTTSTGQVVEVTGPPGSTYEEAQAIFNQQSTTGSLVGLKAGDVLNSIVQAKGGLATAWAQLTTAFSQNNSLRSSNTSIAIPNLPAQNPVNISTFVNTSVLASGKVGPLSSTQVQGLMASTAAAVNQHPTDVTNEKGLGTYGLTPNQLQQAGLIKPGTAELINQDPANTVSILSSPTVWTGKGGATDLDAVLTNETLQAAVQQDSMATSYDQLTQLGAVNANTVDSTLDPYAGLTEDQLQRLGGADPTDPIVRYRLGLPKLPGTTLPGENSIFNSLFNSSSSSVGPIVNNAANYGVGPTLDWLKNTVGGSSIGQLTTSAINSIFGQSFGTVNQTVSGGGNPLQTGIQSPKGYSNTVNRSVIDASFNSIIGNEKIPKTIFAQPTLGVNASTVRTSATTTVSTTTSLLQQLASTPAGAAALTAAAGASAGAASLLATIQSGVSLYNTAQNVGKQIESLQTLLASPQVTNLIKELPGGQLVLDSFKDGTGGAFDAAAFEGFDADPVLAEANLEAVSDELAGFGEGAVFDSEAFAADYGSGDVASDLADFFG